MRKIIIFFAVLTFALPVRAAMLVDDCETGTVANNLSGTWGTYNDGFSSVSFLPAEVTAYAGNYCRRINWALNAGAVNQYAGATTGLNAGWTGVDLSAYEGLRFYAKGSESYKIGIGTDQTRAESNHYETSLNPAASWQLYEIPFSSLAQTWGTAKPWEPSTVFSIAVTAVGFAGTSGSLYIDNLEFYTSAEATPPPDPNVIIQEPKINQVGFLPQAKKYFTVVTNTASAGDAYIVFDASGNTALSGVITGTPVDDRPSTGEGVFKVDISGLTGPGTYHISVRNKNSHDFRVSENVYDGLFKDALRTFYINRCGYSVNDAKSGISHPACHAVPDTVRGGSGTRDASGGWHNAGDFGKWAHMEAISCAYMMWLYELRKDKMRNLKNNIPESNNAVSDLLDEAKWGLDWLLKMQLPDGSVYHKSDTEPNFCFGTKPENDPYTRYVSFQNISVQAPSSIDAAVFTAAMAQAAMVYKPVLPAFAEKCRVAAIKSYAWLKNNRGTGQADPYYTDPDSWQEEEWAFAEIFRLTGDSEAADLFDADTDIHALGEPGWQAPEFFGYFSIWKDERTPQALKEKVRTRAAALCDSLVSKGAASGYGVARASNEYWWESNESILHLSCNLLMTYEMTGTTAYRDTALDQLGYILGNNSMDKSFVTKYGTNYASKPYHWTWYDYGVLIPGWTSGGANSMTGGADAPLIALINKGTPPAKCWLDLAAANGSWASNEGETTETAALVFLSGFFLSGDDAAAGLDTKVLPVKGADDVIAYPSPCNMTAGDMGITFYNMPQGASLQIYGLTGGLVHKVIIDAADGVYFWDLAGQSKNEATAPGVYIYTVTGADGFVKRGKVAVIR